MRQDISLLSKSGTRERHRRLGADERHDLMRDADDGGFMREESISRHASSRATCIDR